MTTDELRDKLNAEGEQTVGWFKAIPLWRKLIYGAALLFILAWLGWYLFWPEPATAPQTFAKAMPAHQVGGVMKVPGPTIAAPLKVIPRAVVRKQLPDLPLADDEEVIDTAEVPKAPYGAVTVTKIDPAGLATTYVKANERPAFEFMKETEIGGGMDLNTHGEKVIVLEGRFVPLRIGSAHLAIKAEGDFIPDAVKGRTIDGRIGVRLFGRFD
jgi:hypothetical protein